MITLYSSFSNDKVFDEKGKLISVKEKGGPAFYIESVFKENGLPYTLKVGKLIEVEIKLIKNKEIGRVKEKIKPKRISLKDNNDSILISTIGREWMLGDNIPESARIFLDIQGHVRDLKHFGKKTFFNDPFMKNVFCLKGTAEEMKYLPKEIIKNQKNKCLIITKGSDGLILYDKGKKFLLKPKRKIQCKDTIGAGDTLFANVVSQFLKTGNTLKSARYAIGKTSEFLSAKTN